MSLTLVGLYRLQQGFAVEDRLGVYIIAEFYFIYLTAPGRVLAAHAVLGRESAGDSRIEVGLPRRKLHSPALSEPLFLKALVDPRLGQRPLLLEQTHFRLVCNLDRVLSTEPTRFRV